MLHTKREINTESENPRRFRNGFITKTVIVKIKRNRMTQTGSYEDLSMTPYQYRGFASGKTRKSVDIWAKAPSRERHAVGKKERLHQDRETYRNHLKRQSNEDPLL